MRFVTGLLCVFVLLGFSVSCRAGTFYLSPSGDDAASGTSESAPWKSFARAFGGSGIGAGGELVLLDGNYSDALGTGCIIYDDGSHSRSAQPPSGTALTNMTRIRAANTGKVKVSGDPARTYYPHALFLGLSASKCSYVKIQGILFEGGGFLWNTSYDTIKECGFHSETMGPGAVFGIGVSPGTHTNGNSFNLVEDCWIWGKERGIASNYAANSNVWRRVVIRGDGGNSPAMIGSGNPNIGITVYNSMGCSLQNVIVVDRVLGGGYPHGSFATAQHEPGDLLGPNEWLGCIALHSEDGGFIFGADAANPNTYLMKNNISWDTQGGGIDIPLHAADNTIIENATIGLPGVDSDGLRCDPVFTSGNIRNIISYGSGRYGINTSIALSYCDVFASGMRAYYQYGTSPSVGGITNNPLGGGTNAPLRYLVRIEQGSLLKGAGLNGADYGANVVKRYGIDGARCGEAGYNSLTATDLWPFPDEDLIKRDFAQSSLRGFCATGTGLYGGPVTLTSYIWETLGNPMPAEVYGSTVPLRFSADASMFGVRSNGFGFTITGPTNLVVVVQSCTNLRPPVWSAVGTSILAGGSAYFNDAAWTNCVNRFYRIALP